ncbi:MAG: VWA domain-containing protein [Candidatus Sulfopaludibacter sp.]|nr:VWA domain-containing protein [Candidatus Sulfopaludibacter sp.]
MLRVGLLLLLSAFLGAQTPPAEVKPVPLTPDTPQNQNAPEMSQHDEQASFRTKVNLVMVPVVVRNVHGDAVGNLAKENFLLYDKGKPQIIERFSVETTKVPANVTDSQAPAATGEGEPAIVIPDRFVALVFDDIHLAPQYLTLVREAADRFIEALSPTERIAVYAMSGEVSQDFTGDRPKLHEALARIRPNLMVRTGALNDVDQRTLISLDNLKAVVKRLGVTPGQRTMIFISPGFNTWDPMYVDYKVAIIEQAIRSKVIISALDARGLYTDPAFKVAPGGPRTLTQMQLNSDVMAELASGTGGSLFENSNSYDEGFRRIAAAPEYLYLLGFSPQNLKSDGSFHSLKVSLKNVPNMALTARHGYYAPKKTEDAAEAARQEIEAALFSHDEMAELPIEMHTQFFKATDQDAKLSVMAHLDLKQFKFHKADGRNVNNVTVVSGIFDSNGNYLQGIRKVVELHLKDETLARLASGVTVKTTFDLKPGTYLVRLVVRDTEGQALSATNNAVEIR